MVLGGVDGRGVRGRRGAMRKRYDFICVDKHDDGTGALARSRKDSIFYCQKVIANSGVDLN